MATSPNTTALSAKDAQARAFEERTKFFDDFSYILKDALRLESAGPGVFRSVHLWTPVAQRSVYGGQLVAHTVESAYRTVDADRFYIHSLRISFLAAGRSRTSDPPIEYHVSSLRDGRSFCSREVRAKQAGRVLLVAVAGFHKREEPGIQHELAPPTEAAAMAAAKHVSLRDAMQAILDDLLRSQPLPTRAGQVPSERGPETEVAAAAHVQYVNLFPAAGAGGELRSADPLGVWVRLGPRDMQLLAGASGIPLPRLPLVVSCWLSDFIVALSSLLPHGLPNPNLRMIASLDHAIYFHNPQRVKVDDWFMYEVRSSWAGNNRALNHGRMYGRDGRLWMSVAQETVLRMRRGYQSKL